MTMKQKSKKKMEKNLFQNERKKNKEKMKN